jgi:geranylgeranyl pyrophosphate synthase
MSATTAEAAPTAPSAAAETPKKRKPSTAHLKLIPETRALRDRIRAEAAAVADTLDRSRTIAKEHLEKVSRDLLARLGLPEGYLGFTMVLVSNEFWRPQLMATDFKKRLLLMPHCLKHMDGCPAEYDEFGLDCKKCGACSIADYKTRAEDLGYKVLVAEGTPIVLKIIVSGQVDGIVGVACLNVLEKAIDKILKVGIPALAVPLLSSDCKNTSVDADWVTEVIGLRTEPKVKTKTYVHLMRAAARMFEGPELERLIPRARAGKDAHPHGHGRNGHGRNGHGHAHAPAAADPIGGTERIAYEYLTFGGKRSRPFITLAAYDALKNAGAGTWVTDAKDITLPDEVRRAAMAIEVFHKASLVHDDIEDDDGFRYGKQTLHHKHGVPTAINVGDYLIGLGYRLVARDRKALGADAAADVLNRLADAHTKLSEGQGAELLWRDAADQTLAPLDALKIYALKTAPAFEAALYTGLRLAGDAAGYENAVVQFSRNLGVAFQILNDLKDWDEGAANKGAAGGDVLGARPTVLLALAMEAADAAGKAELASLLRDRSAEPQTRLRRVREFFEAAAVFDKAEGLIAKYRAKAEAVADEIEPAELRELLYFLVDTVLEREEKSAPDTSDPMVALPMAAMSAVAASLSVACETQRAAGA